MDLRKIKKLMELFADSSVGEIEIREADQSIRLSKSSQAASTPVPARAQERHAREVLPTAEPHTADEQKQPAAPPAEDTSGADTERTADEEVVKSPMVGTFYRSSSPDTPPFVEPGDLIEAGETLCIIEAMKTMNQIPAPTTGMLKRFLAENGAPVEFGQPIAIINSLADRSGQ